MKSTLKKDPSETLTCYKSRLVHHQHDAFLSTFSLCRESATYNQFQENLKNIVGNIQKANITKKAKRQIGKMHPLKKRHIMETFSLDNWVDLKDRESKHTIFDFKGCLQNKNWKDALAVLPVRDFLRQKKAKNNRVN